MKHTQTEKEPRMMYKVSCNIDDQDFYTNDENEARQKFDEYKKEYGDGIRLYEGIDANEEDAPDWSIIDGFDKEDEEEEMRESIKVIDEFNELLLTKNGVLVLKEDHENNYAVISGKVDDTFIKSIFAGISKEGGYECKRIIEATSHDYGYCIRLKVEVADFDEPQNLFTQEWEGNFSEIY